MKLDQAIKHAIDGNAVLFLGSGYSIGAENIYNTEFLPGKSLAKSLCDELEISEELPLDMASDIYIKEKGANNIIKKLNDLYFATKTNESQNLIASLPWKKIYTTNYDNVFELSAISSKKRIIPITIDENPQKHIGVNNICVHINGYIDKLNNDTLKQSFKLTASSYLTDEFSSSRWGSVFRQDLNLAKSIIFIGYSLYDIDIQRIIVEQNNLKEKCIFIVGKDPKISEKHIIEKYGVMVTGGHVKFSEAITNIIPTYKKQLPALELYSFEEITVSERRSEIPDESLSKLLLYGEYSTDNIFTSVTKETNRPYYIHRKEFTSICDSISSGKIYFIIHSDIGNGKTLLVEGISANLLHAGYRIFNFKEYPEYAPGDLEQIYKLKEKCLIIIENYNRMFPAIEYIASHHPGNKVVIFTERSSLHEYHSDELYKKIVKDEIEIYDCNKLKLDETDRVISLIESAPLWGEKSEWTRLKKRRYIQNDLKSEFQSILLDIIKSPDLHNRLRSIFCSITGGTQLYNVITLSLILKHLNYSSDSNIISDLINVNSLSTVTKSIPREINELLKLSSNGISIKSSVLSKYILNNFASSMHTVDLLVTVVNKLYLLLDFNFIYKNIYFDLQRYSVVQSLLPDSGKRESLIKYFESIKNIGKNIWSPHFWVQYGIARLSFKDYDLANDCFNTAYGYAKSINHFDTHQIDNHYSRLCIEVAIKNKNKEEGIKAVSNAHKLLYSQMNRIDYNKHYPFRVAASYFDIVNTFYSQLNKSDKIKLISYSDEILNKIQTLPYHFSQNRYVDQCRKNMEKIKQMLTS